MEPEENQPPRICSIVSLDIAHFSQQPGEVQFSWRIELSMLLDRCLEGMEPDRRIVTDTSSGAVLAFTLSPEDAFSFLQRLYNELPKLQDFALRVGVHLGPLRVVQGSSGRPGIAGEGINAAQRAMRFAGANDALVSRAFQEEIIRLALGNADMFSRYGKQSNKLGREHDLFRMRLQPAPSEPTEPDPLKQSASPEFSALLGPSALLEPVFLEPVVLEPVLLEPSAPPAPSVLLESPAPLEPSATPEPPAIPALPEPSEPLVSDTQNTSTTLPTAKSPGFGIKTIMGVFLIVVACIGLWVALSNSKHRPTPPSAVNSAAPDSATPAPEHSTNDSQVPAQPEPTNSDVSKQPHLTVDPTSGKVATPKKDPRGSLDRCPNCSCTDLMTKLSLGSALNQAERRYLAEHCKK